MSIKLVFGNVGSGKTASIVRMMKNNKHKNFITNIHVRGKDFKHVRLLKADMIIKKNLVNTKKDGTKVYKKSLNIDFWKQLITKEKSMNIILDEAHTLLNPRRSMSDVSRIMTDFLALLRRVLGSVDNAGDLILITQLSRRLDVIAREMSNNVTFCIHHYISQCSRCGIKWQESNETANKVELCFECGGFNLKRIKSVIEVLDFQSMDDFESYKEYGNKTYYSRYMINNIEKIFGNYDTLQFDDLLSEY